MEQHCFTGQRVFMSFETQFGDSDVQIANNFWTFLNVSITSVNTMYLWVLDTSTAVWRTYLGHI